MKLSKLYLPQHSVVVVLVALFLCFLTACAGKLTSKFDVYRTDFFFFYLTMSCFNLYENTSCFMEMIHS